LKIYNLYVIEALARCNSDKAAVRDILEEEK
jgi:hypothetical protein